MRTQAEVRGRLELVAAAVARETETIEKAKLEAVERVLRWVLEKWPYPHPFEMWKGRSWCGKCGRDPNDELHVEGTDGSA